jgi:hypothetical protein
MAYTVLVDDNFHYMDVEERYTFGEYETLEEAIIVCKSIVDQYLKEIHEPGITAEAMYKHYVSFGEDPFIRGVQATRREDVPFSAWTYARKRCEEICGGKVPGW